MMKSKDKKAIAKIAAVAAAGCLAFSFTACNTQCEHDYSYRNSDTQHWQYCPKCETETEKKDHVYGDDGNCVCGAEKVVSFGVEASVNLNVDATHTLSITNVVGIDKSELVFSSYDETVATVSDAGVITGVNEGETTVLIKAGKVRKQVAVKVVETNKVNNVSYKKLKAIAAYDWQDTGIGNGAEGALTNIAWNGATAAATAEKMDFENTKANDVKTLRGSVYDAESSIDNGEYVIVMSSARAVQGADFGASVYYKTTVSELANSYRLWGWASKSDLDVSPASGKGKFRVSAYIFNAEYTSYTQFVLPALDTGTLVQDENGWVKYEDVDDVNAGHIAGAPADNMFVYGISDENTDLRGKEVILSVEFMSTNADKPDRFGIKRLGFIYDDAPDFNLTSSANVELFANGTAQIECGTQGAAATGKWTYVSGDESVATVSASGLITAADVTEQAQTVITVTNSAVQDKAVNVNVTVKPTPQTSFNVPETVTVACGESVEIAITDKVNCEEGFTFETGSARIATVDGEGRVSGVVAGSTKVKVSCGELYKFVNVVVEAKTLYGLTFEQLATVGTLGSLGGFPAALDFTWSGLTTADNISDDITDAKVHLYSADASALNDLADPNLVNMICNISGQSGAGVTNALYYKCDTPAAAGEYRVWIRANEALEGISDKAYFRVVVYILNEDGTAYVPHIMKLNASAAPAVQDENTGIITITGGAPDNFVNFVPTPDILGKTGVIISVETFADNGSDLQSRAIVRRLGFDA